MFSLITEIPLSSFEPIPSGNSEGIKSQQKKEFKKRVEVISSYFKGLGEKAGMTQSQLINLNIIPNSAFDVDSACAKHYFIGPNQIETPLMYFFDFEKDFNINSLDDLNKKLGDLGWVQEFLNKIADTLDYPHLTASEELRDVLRKEVDWMKNNPEKASDGCRFVMLHELGHIHDPNLTNGKRIVGIFAFSLFGMTSMAILFTSSIFIVAAATTALGIILTPGAVATTTILLSFISSLAITTVVLKILLAQFGKSKEMYADKFAASAFKGDKGEKIRQGGIYYFNYTKVMHNKLGLYSKLTDPHPTHQERIRMLENYVV